MGYTPLYVGQTHVKLFLTWIDDTGISMDLTNASITVRFATDKVATSFSGTGAVTITDAVNGKFTYVFSNADVATAGSYQVQWKAVYGDGTVNFSDPATLVILADT